MVVVTVIIQPWSLYFQNDDFIYVSKAPLGNYLYRTAFRPVSDLTLLTDYLLYCKNGGGFHVSNLLFHFIAAVLLFFTARKWLHAMGGANDSDTIAHIAALLFLVYPFHSESLLWTIGRGGSLVTIFFLGALNFILTKPLRRQHWLGANLALVAGLFTYESIWLLPLVATLLVWIKNDHRITIPLEKWGLTFMWVLLLVSFVVRKMLINDFIGSPYLNTTHFELSLPKQAYKYATGFFRSFLPPTDSGQLFLILSFLLAMLLLAIIIRFFRQSPRPWRAAAPFIVFVITLLPVSILAVNTHTTESERFLYLPSAFLCLQAAMLIHATFASWKRWAVVLLAGCYSLFFLSSAAGQYRLAGNWNKITLQAIGRHEGHYKTIHVYNLPSAYKGAYMFRLGFEEALQWICPGVQYDRLIIHCSQVITEPKDLQVVSTPDTHMQQFIPKDAVPESLYVIWNKNQLFVGSLKP